MRLHFHSIRARILILSIVPLFSLIGLYAFTTTITASDALTLARATEVRNSIADPIGLFASQVQQERLLATRYLTGGTPGSLAALTAQEGKTDAALAGFRSAADSGGTVNASGAPVRAAVAAALRDAAGLPALRAEITAGKAGAASAQTAYAGMIAAGYQAIAAAVEQMPDVTLDSQAISVLQIAQAEDVLLSAQALLAGDETSGALPAAAHAQFARLTGQYQGLLAQALTSLSPAYRAPFQHALDQPAAASLTAAENAIINAPPGTHGAVKASIATYNQVVPTIAGGLAGASFQAGNTLASALHAQARPIDTRLIVAGSLGLLAILVSIAVSIWMGRGLIRQLAGLRQEAMDLARRRLPQVMARLNAGEDVNIRAEAPPLTTSGDEIGQVRRAFNTVQRSAIQAAAEQAQLRAGVSTLFRNLARRNQSLLHQQLSLLDALEQRATEPDELERLFRIDHLTTRMRRHAESLVVLAGEQSGRVWSGPVPMLDVLRGAVAEVMDYARIRVACVSRSAIKGHAAADVIHLIAELAENGTAFSPPDAPVRVFGSQGIHGFAVEIEDRGLGIPEEMMDELNAALADPPPFNPSSSEQLGLYVAARLAQRHCIRITLRPSPFGGTTAIVLIPHDLIITDAHDDGGKPPGPAAAAPRTGRHVSRNLSTGSPAPLDAGDRPPGPPRQPDRPLGAPDAAWRAARRDPSGAARSGTRPGPGADVALDPRLPIRTRQASLPDYLRHPPTRRPTARPAGPQATPGVAEHEDAPYPDPSPDDVRSAMTAMQRGWERGRGESSDFGAMAEADDEGHPGPGRDSALSRRSTSDDA